jgi:EmrB/QacA subfamily drug resistance transporter
VTPRRGAHRSERMTLVTLVVAAFAYSLQQTLVVPALPVLQRDLHTTTAWSTWIFTGFLLSASVATPILGKLGDQYGRDRLLLVALGLFLLGCVGAAAAWDIWSLILFRVLQGAAGAIFPLSFSIVRDEFPSERIGVTIGTISAIFGIGGAGGLVLSGLIVDNLSWRWLFILGAVPIAAAIALAWRFIPPSPVKTPTRIDVPGAVLLAVGLLSGLLAITEGPTWGWSSGRVVGLFAAAFVVLAAWVRVELRVAEPMVDIRMLLRRAVFFANLSAFITGFAMYSLGILTPKFAETPRGLGPAAQRLVHYGFNATTTKAGLYLAPGAALMLVAGPLAGLIGRRVGSKWPLMAGMTLIGLGSGGLALFHDHPWQLILAMVAAYTGISMSFASMSTIITETVKPTETGVANGMNTVLRTVGGVIGAQIGATILTAHLVSGTNVAARSGYVTAFTLYAIALLIGAGLSVFVTPRRARRASTVSA